MRLRPARNRAPGLRAPELSLQLLTVSGGGVCRRAAGTEFERRMWCPCSAPAVRANRFAWALRGSEPQVGRSDRVGVLDDGRAARLVASTGERQAEREDEPDDPEQRRLQGGEGLANRVRPGPQVAADRRPITVAPMCEAEEDER